MSNDTSFAANKEVEVEMGLENDDDDAAAANMNENEEASTSSKITKPPPAAKKQMRHRMGDASLLYDLEHGTDGNSKARKQRVGKWSDLLLIWVLPYLWHGYSAPIEERDVPTNPPDVQSKKLSEEAEVLWEQEVAKKGPEKASLLSVMLKIQRWELVLGVILSVIQGLLFSVARPLLLGFIIRVVADENESTETGIYGAIAFAFVIFFQEYIQSMVKQLLANRNGSRFLSWIAGIFLQKSTRVNGHSVSVAGLQETNLIGADVIRMLQDWNWMCLLPFCIVSLIGGVAVLAVTMGIASLVGFAIMFGIVFMNLGLTKKVKKVAEKDFGLGDQRMGILREVLAGIKAIKMMAWEIPFQKQLTNARDLETNEIRKWRTLSVTSINLGRASPALASCFSILALALLNPEDLTAETVFIAISAYQGLRLPLISIPQQTAMLANTLVSFGRLRQYLVLKDAPPAKKLGPESDKSIVIKDASFQWTVLDDQEEQDVAAAKPDGAEKTKSETGKELEKGKEKIGGTKPDIPSSTPAGDDETSGSINFKLQDINLSVKRDNHLVAVVGRVGSGKTSVLSSIVGSMFIEKGSVELIEDVAFVPQKAFVMSGTITDNVVMGHDLDEDRFQRVVKASALDYDLQNFPDGRETELGESGRTLSGGQAARVSIARALYHNPEVLLIDDMLSAVDPEVANKLFRRTVLGFLGRAKTKKKLYSDEENVGKKRSVLMTLNQLHLLPNFDHIVVLKDGKIAEQGTFEELMGHDDSALSKLMEGTNVVFPAAAKATNEMKGHETDTDIETETDNEGTGGNESDDDDDEEEEEDDEEEKEKQLGKHHTLVTQEKGERGAVSSKIIRQYLAAMGWHRLPFSFLFAAGAYAFMASADLYLANWIRTADANPESAEHLTNAFVYIALALGNVIGVEILSLHNTRSSAKASKNIHHACMSRILHAPISWFEETPSGRITSRFSGDLSLVDRQLQFIFDDLFQFVFLLLALCVVICYIVPELIPIVIIGLFLFGLQVRGVDRTNREVKRYTNQALSPILTNISETINARDLIRVMKLESFFCRRQYIHVDRYTCNIYLSNSLVNFSTLVAGFVSFLLSSAAALTVVYRREFYDPALVGLALTYSFLVPYFLSILSIVFPLGFAALTSLERVVEYKGDFIPQEAPWECSIDEQLIETGTSNLQVVTDSSNSTGAEEGSPTSFIVPKEDGVNSAWPSKGKIEFCNVSLVYRPGLPPALRGVSATIEGGEKVGVIGRTGSSKSTLCCIALFRVNELSEGKILIDGQDISEIGLQLLRKSLTIIPQTPLLFAGSLRKNLDPFGIYTDEQLLVAMRKVGLNPILLDQQLPDDPKENENKKSEKQAQAQPPKSSRMKRMLSRNQSSSSGAAAAANSSSSSSKKMLQKNKSSTVESLSMSVGEKQLLSLARACLRDAQGLKIVVLDEPTANLDQKTDARIQAVVRNEFASSTTLTIAHRLASIASSDKILVMRSGQVAEFDSPENLMANPESEYSSMLRESNSQS